MKCTDFKIIKMKLTMSESNLNCEKTLIKNNNNKHFSQFFFIIILVFFLLNKTMQFLYFSSLNFFSFWRNHQLRYLFCFVFYKETRYDLAAWLNENYFTYVNFKIYIFLIRFLFLFSFLIFVFCFLFFAFIILFIAKFIITS